MLCLRFKIKCDTIGCKATVNITLEVIDIYVDLNAQRLTFGDIAWELRKKNWDRKYVSGYGQDGSYDDRCPKHKDSKYHTG